MDLRSQPVGDILGNLAPLMRIFYIQCPHSDHRRRHEGPKNPAEDVKSSKKPPFIVEPARAAEKRMSIDFTSFALYGLRHYLQPIESLQPVV